MLDDFGRADRAHTERVCEALAARVSKQEAGGEQVAGAGGVDQFLDRLGGNIRTLAAANGKGPVLAARDDQGLDFRSDRGDGAVEMRNAGERVYLRLIGKKDVDPAAVEQLIESVAVAVDAKCVGESERD